MPGIDSIQNDFIIKITEIIEDNISNEQFGVSELADKVNMSRSNLLRKVKKITGLSVSQFIRQVRLQYAMELLKQQSYTVSEVTYKVGFGSTSYFIKCFHDHFGYPPGEVGQKIQEQDNTGQINQSNNKRKFVLIISAILLFILIIVLFSVIKPVAFIQRDLEKSIAVLPFKNDSNDSTNIYIINGLMESVLNNLQAIEDLRVVSRTSVEKYRNSSLSIPEIAREMGVSYFVEGSGQKIGDQVLLNVQLIEGTSDKHIWGGQFEREATNIFDLQNEVAKKIAEEIKVFVSPEEEQRINKIPTENPLAYDYFLKGQDLLNRFTIESIKRSVPYFYDAIEEDPDYARAYAAVTIAYYFLDEDQVEKKYTDSINIYADKALLLDPQLPQSLIAKGLYYMANFEYKNAAVFFEKTLEYHPNNDLVLIFLMDLYVDHIPDTEKYLEYALLGTKLDISLYDSTIASYSYMQISNAFIQSGFIDEAEEYINKSLEYLPGNLYAQYLRAYILFTQDQNLDLLRKRLIETLEKDPTRIDIIQEAGKICYFMRDYQSAYSYYKTFLEIREAMGLDIYHSEDGKIGVVLSELGMEEEAEKLLSDFKAYAENDQSVYKNINLAMYYAYMGDTLKSIDYLELFSLEENYHYWTILFFDVDPLVDAIKEMPEFRNIYTNLKNSFQEYQENLRDSLESKGLL